MHQAKIFRTTLGAAELTVELTPLAGQANGSVIVRSGDTTVLVTAVMAKIPREGGDFFPLTVDYEERFYAAGKIIGSRFPFGEYPSQSICSSLLFFPTVVMKSITS